MEASSKLFLDTCRHHLEYLERNGGVRNLQVDRMREIMVKEFIPSYGNVDPFVADQVAELLRDTYAQYDKWLAANQY